MQTAEKQTNRTDYLFLFYFQTYVDNLFTSIDLLDHMGDRQLGVTGTLRQNRLHGVPLPTKKEVEKNFVRGQSEAVYTQDSIVVVWKDNKPVYMASNCDDMEPFSSCQRYNKQAKGYMAVPQPSLNDKYNASMGGVDLVDNAEKNYAIVTRCKKWYWSLYAWFLNIIMLQAWRLFRAHKREQSKLKQEQEKEDDKEMERRMEEAGYLRGEININMKERALEKKCRRAEEKKLSDISLLEFTRQVVDVTIRKHGRSAVSQQEASAQLGPNPSQLTPGGKLSAVSLEAVRYDSGRHLPKKTAIQGVCKECRKRSFFRCIRCKVALHAECFYPFHVPKNEREEDD